MPFDFKPRMLCTVEARDGDTLYGDASYDPMSAPVIVGDVALPKKILFRSGGGELPWMAMGIEIVDGAPECTYLEYSYREHDGTTAGVVRDKHLKLTQIETLVHVIATSCARKVEPAKGGVAVSSGPTTPRQKRAVAELQRRRRDPNDREILGQVAALYKANPGAPIKAVVDGLGMSESTAKRWAKRCSEIGLLPPAEKKGKMRK